MPRLDPSTTTITKLIMASGAKCAFPGCSQLLIEGDQLIGQICHIEAASPTGQRYNPEQSDNDRRSYENLILLCANHHKVTDNTEIYTVEKLKEMKHEHESKMEDEPAVDLIELNQVMANIAPNDFRYTFTGSFQPYKEYEFRNDVSQIEGKLRAQVQAVKFKAGNSSAADYAEQIFSQELAKANRPLLEKKANSERMYEVEKNKIDEFYNELHTREMGKLRERGMDESGQVIVLEEKIAKYKSMAIEELNALYGKSV